MSVAAEAVDKYVADRREERFGARDYWNPSTMGGCDRAAVLKRAGVEGTPFSPRTKRKFWMGDRVHEGLTAAVVGGLPPGWQLLGADPAVRVRDEESKLSCRPDLLLRNPAGELEIWEFKSKNSMAFKYDVFQQDHMDQAIIGASFYPAIVQDFGDVTIFSVYAVYPARVRLVYWSKDDADMAEFVEEMSEERRGRVRSRLAELERLYEAYTASGSLPDKISDAWVPITLNGEPQFYVKGPKKGQPKLEQNPSVKNCRYLGTGKCCADS